MSAQPTETIEDYLAAIYVMERDGEPIVPAKLARILGVAPPTVTVTLQRMQRDHWLSAKGDHLTEEGLLAAQAVVRRHMLAEWMLSRYLKIPLASLHEEAHRLEHAISGEIEKNLALQLENPEQCPHGNPLPGHEESVSGWRPLTASKAGERITIRRLHERAEDNREILDYLVSQGVVPGTSVRVTDVSAVNETVSLLRGNTHVVLGFSTARHVFGEVEAA
ncbi:MAG: metal-dependent transcriptional regulator [Spirochaetes bacterium]|nr:metal-dependent transcriptional regulator [Spirochaetota bacterium]